MNSHSRSRVAADILLLLLLGVLSAVEKAPALGADAMVSSTSATGHFPLSHQGQAAALFVSSNDWPGVLRAVNDLGQDIQRVTGTQPQVIYNLSANPKQAVIIGTIARSPLIEQLVHAEKMEVTDIVGKWESYFLQVVTNPFPNMETALVICGSDKRGAIYGIYDLAEQIGVSPWHYWSDNSAKKSAQLYIRPGKFVTGPPAVKYRGIFLNDEAPALSGWVEKNYGQVTGLRGVANYGRGFYTNVFELMLRLRANYLWPAMWNNAFNEDDPENPRLADEYGIVMGTSHQEPMLRAQKEWDRGLGRQQGNWDYNKTNQRPTLHQFWREGVRRNKACESIITMGLRAENYCFHDRDVAPEGRNLRATNKNFDAVAKVLQEEQKRTGIKRLWGTANLFSNPRYMHGASTSCNAEVFAYAAAQVKKAMEVTHQLGGEGYTFWGGREGYQTLLNTDMKREQEHLAKLLHLAVAHKKQIGFKGQFYIEPKPKEPTKHQYDSDSAACLNFLREFDLLPHFKLNLETNHATLAGHTMQHELEVARAAGALGSIDANTGDELLGWDTDQFPTSIYLTTYTMLSVLKYGGFKTGGVNFDAKVRRGNFEPVDLFHAHIGGMDAFARGLKIAAAIRQDGRLEQFVKQRYASWDTGLGAKIEAGKVGFKELEAYMLKQGDDAPNTSGRQEFLENLINEFI